MNEVYSGASRFTWLLVLVNVYMMLLYVFSLLKVRFLHSTHQFFAFYTSWPLARSNEQATRASRRDSRGHCAGSLLSLDSYLSISLSSRVLSFVLRVRDMLIYIPSPHTCTATTVWRGVQTMYLVETNMGAAPN